MSKKANPTAIGLFFAIGLALGVAGMILFSSRALFHSQHKDILYFNASLKGLNVGAPVKFRGVTIGSVERILIRHNQASNDFTMPVVISIDKKLAQSISDELLDIGNKSKLDQLISEGFRARLDTESWLPVSFTSGWTSYPMRRLQCFIKSLPSTTRSRLSPATSSNYWQTWPISMSLDSQKS